MFSYLFKYKKGVVVFFLLLLFHGTHTFAQSIRKITLQAAIEIAQQNSLDAMIGENRVTSSQIRFNNFKIEKLPFVGLKIRPFTFNRKITQQFDITDNSYRFFETQNLNTFAHLMVNQNLYMTGGRLFIESDLSRLINFGSNIQFSATPIRVGISQPILGYNPYLWDKQIEPLEFKKAQLQYVKAAEEIAIKTTRLYFDLLFSKLEVETTLINMNNADTLYRIGQKRSEITTLEKSDLMSLRLEYLNSKTEYALAKNRFQKDMSSLVTFLNLDPATQIEVNTPDQIFTTQVDIEVALEEIRVHNPDFINLELQRLRKASVMDKRKKEKRIQTQLNASVGLNQQGSQLADAYTNPLDQQYLNLELNVPILDWGKRKGRYKLAEQDYEITVLATKQETIRMEQYIVNTITDFNLKTNVLENSKEATELALSVYLISKDRFILGLTTVNDLIIKQQRKDRAIQTYLSELRAYWRSYYEIRSMTLFDFEEGMSLVGE